MDHLRSNKTVQRVVLIEPGTSGQLAATVVFQNRRKKKKKQSRLLAPVEHAWRGLVRTEHALVDTYLRRHRRSNRKKRDGWLRDGATNVARAVDKSSRRFLRIF